MRGLRVLGRGVVGLALVGTLSGWDVHAQELLSSTGLVVEKVVPGQAMARAGVRAGDLLLSVERAASRLRTPSRRG